MDVKTILETKIPVFFKNEDVQFIKDMAEVCVTELGALRGEHLGLHEQQTRHDRNVITALSLARDSLKEAIEAQNNQKSPEIDEIRSKLDNLGEKVDRLMVAFQEFTKMELERSEKEENESILRLGNVE